MGGNKKKSAETDEEEAKAEDKSAKAKVEVDMVQDEADTMQNRKRRKGKTDEAYSLTRGVDLVNVSTVINADVPLTVRSYVHRVGRCARGGASGTALTLVSDEEAAVMTRIMRFQASTRGTGDVKPLPMQLADAERFRYRVEDCAKGLKRKQIHQYMARELQLEALNSERLASYFEENPDEKLALMNMQRKLKEKKSIREHLATVPDYLVPEQVFTSATPVQKAVREQTASRGGTRATFAQRKKHGLAKKKEDVLQGHIGK